MRIFIALFLSIFTSLSYAEQQGELTKEQEIARIAEGVVQQFSTMVDFCNENAASTNHDYTSITKKFTGFKDDQFGDTEISYPPAKIKLMKVTFKSQILDPIYESGQAEVFCNAGFQKWNLMTQQHFNAIVASSYQEFVSQTEKQ